MALGAEGGPYCQGRLNSQRGRWELNSQRGLDSGGLLCFSAHVLFLQKHCYELFVLVCIF